MASSPKPPKPIDPNTVINAQSQANRVNRITPFGSQTYGPNGLTTTLSPEMQHMFGNAVNMAQTPLTPLSAPQGVGGLQNQIMQRIAGRYQDQQGGGDFMHGMHPNAQKGMPQSMPLPQVGASPAANIPAFNSALGKIWGSNPMQSFGAPQQFNPQPIDQQPGPMPAMGMPSMPGRMTPMQTFGAPPGMGSIPGMPMQRLPMTPNT